MFISVLNFFILLKLKNIFICDLLHVVALALTPPIFKLLNKK